MIDGRDGTDARYARKIRSRDELRAIIGPRPRGRSVVMCHGTFDLVHPGHLRHLMYARSRGDVLVASLTCDAHVSKANYRPFVPQQLRAMTLAALEVVDYVIVDERPTALENLAYLQPDFFAKGYEYIDNGIHPNTREELRVLESYGGQLIFTPGDVVFSSTRFIEAEPPRIGLEKLLSLMAAEGLTFETLRQAIDQCRDQRVHLLGDSIVDSYRYCTPLGASTSKTPTISVRLDEQVDFAGGAAVVARHLRAAGADVTFSTLLGDDDAGRFVLSEMEKHDVRCRPVIDPHRLTTRKVAYIADGYRLLKVDEVDNRPVAGGTLTTFRDALAEADPDAYVFSDFRHGIFNKASIGPLTAALRPGALRVADSQVASRWGNILEFRGFDLITPNEKEARFALADQDSHVPALAEDLYQRADCRVLILKLGARGVITRRAPSTDAHACFTIDAMADPLVDPVGAGDALLAYATLALRATGNPVIASILGTMAAAAACAHDGNIPVRPDQLLATMALLERQVLYT